MGGAIPAIQVVDFSDVRVGGRRAAALKPSMARIARLDPCVFAQYVMKHEETGRGIFLAPMHRAWHDLLSRNDRLVLWSHVEAGKSTQVSTARVLWEIGRDPSLRVLILSAAHAQSAKLIGTLAAYIENSTELHEVFPDLVPTKRTFEPWKPLSGQLTVRRATVSKDATITAAGVHSSILGARYDLVVIDDILDFENTRTLEQRKRLVDWLQATVHGRLTRKGRMWVVGTAWHPGTGASDPGDALHFYARQFSSDGVQRAFKYPVVDERGQSRWPEQWPSDRIDKRRQSMTSMEFARQMLCQARDDSQSRFKQEYVDVALGRGREKTMAYALRNIPVGCKTYTGVDLAVQRHSAADLTVLTTIIVHPNGDRELLEIQAGRWAGPDIVSKIVDVHHRYQSVVIVENNACFPPDSCVLTSTGYKSISQVNHGEMVLTHLGNWRRVLCRTEKQFIGELCVVKPSGGLTVRCTPNHAFWVRASGRLKGGRKGKDVGKHRPIGEPSWASAITLSAGHNGSAFYTSTPLAKWKEYEARVELERYAHKRTVGVDERLALFLGLFLAEGHASSSNAQVTFTMHAREHHLRSIVQGVATGTFGATYFNLPMPGEAATRTTVNSVEARRLCMRIGKGTDKQLPWEWMGWPLIVRLAIIRGWFLGDGCLRSNNESTKWPAKFLSGFSISRNWIAQVRATLVEAGLRPTLKVTKPRSSMIGDRQINGRGGFQISLNASDTVQFLSWAVSEEERVHWVALSERAREANSACVIEGDSMWSKLRGVESESYEGLVYNLVVEDDQSYVVDDVAVHNSQDFIIQFTRHTSAVPVRPFTTGAQKAHPEFGVESLAAEMQSGKWIFPCKGGESPELMELINEMLYYAPDKHTGDRLMSLWFAREGAKMGAVQASYARVDLLSR